MHHVLGNAFPSRIALPATVQEKCAICYFKIKNINEQNHFKNLINKKQIYGTNFFFYPHSYAFFLVHVVQVINKTTLRFISYFEGDNQGFTRCKKE